MVLRGKKGVFFTMAVIVIIAIFFMAYAFVSNVGERKTSQKRVVTIDNFVSSLEEDLARKSKISGFRIIFLFEKELLSTGEYISNINSSVEEIFFNGTLDGTPQDPSLIEGITFSDILESINEKSEKIGVNVSLTNPSITITQDDPWNLKVNFSADLFLEDEGEKISWDKRLDSVSYISIGNFEDPIYLINTNGLIAQKIVQTPYDVLVQGGDTTNLSSHLSNSYYLNSTEAPSFLDRLGGNINTESQYGIESLVNLDDLTSKGISIKDKSIVDHIYFSSENPSTCSISVSGLPSWFRMDSAHSSIYDVC